MSVDGVRRQACVRVLQVGIGLVAQAWDKNVPENIYLRPEIAGGCLSRNDEIGIVDPERLMHAARTHVGNHCGKARGKLMLHVKIPLHHISALRVWVGIGGAQSIRGELNILAPKVEKWIGTRSCVRTYCRWLFVHGILKERGRLSCQKDELIGQRLHVEHADPTTDRRFTIL